MLIADKGKVKSWSTDMGPKDRAKPSGLEAPEEVLQEVCGPNLTKFCWPERFRSAQENEYLILNWILEVYLEDP